MNMPPKKKKVKKKKPQEKQIEEDTGSSLFQIESLQRHLELQTEMSRRAKSNCVQLHQSLLESGQEIERVEKDKTSITMNLTRQYKDMKEELSEQLESCNAVTVACKENIAELDGKLKKITVEKEDVVKTKDDRIFEIEMQMNRMTTLYEDVLQESFKMLTENLNAMQKEWDAEMDGIQQEFEDRLLQFRLDSPDI